MQYGGMKLIPSQETNQWTTEEAYLKDEILSILEAQKPRRFCAFNPIWSASILTIFAAVFEVESVDGETEQALSLPETILKNIELFHGLRQTDDLFQSVLA